MSLLYLVDGYNVLKRCGLFEKDSLKDSRMAFLGYLDHHRLQGSLRNRLVVVFDGSSEVFGEFLKSSCEVIFTRGRSADEEIKEIVAQSQDKKNIVVVSDDKGIILSVRPYGVKIMGALDFINKNKLKSLSRFKRAPQGQELKIDLNIVERESITQELSNIWLKKKK